MLSKENNYYKFIIIIALIILYNYFWHIHHDRTPEKSDKHAKVSIFSPIYNKGKYIAKAITSIQNQTLKDIEIIAINDCSDDNSSEILKGYALNDKRIKIINNKKNYGLLYSRAMGIIHSTGQYLMNLDPDDEFANSDNLEYLFNKANTSGVDIISFGFFLKKRNKTLNLCDKFDTIIDQPKLMESIYNSDNILKDELITNKLIKKEIFLKAYESFYKYIYSGRKWNYHEDNIWSILVHKFASSKLCVKKLIYIYKDNSDSLMKKMGSSLELDNYIYRFDMLNEILNKTFYFKYLNKICISFIGKINFSDAFKKRVEFYLTLENKTLLFFKSCFRSYNISKKAQISIVNIIDNLNKIKV